MYRTNNGKPILLDHRGRPVNHTRDGAAAAGGMALPQGWLFIARLMGGDNTLWLDKFDEAMRQSRTDARSMIADSHLMRLKEERIRAVVTLPWELEIPDEKDERQVQIRDALARQIKSIPFLTRILWGLLEALWFGRAAVQVQWGWKRDRGLKYMVPIDQLPISGDSIGHQEDGTPYILVNAAEADKIPNAEIITTMIGLMGLRLTGSWRQRFIFHKHLMEARDPFAFDEVEAIHGVGIRSKIFWSHWLKLEWLSNITDFFSRVGLGINVWKYEQGNAQARTAVETAAKENTDRANIFIPVDPSGGGKGVQGVERIEVPTSGAQFLRELMEYLDRQMETYVVGQEASSKGSSSGLGNEANADFQMDTKKQIALVDAAWLAESLTGSDRNPSLLNQMAWWYCHANRDKLGELDFPISWRFKVGATQSDKQLGAVKTLVELGVPVKADDVRMAAAMSKPASGDETIKPPQQGMPGSPGAESGNPLAGLLGDQGAEQGGAEQPQGQPPEQGAEQEQPLDPASLPDKGPGSFIKMLLESRGGDGASQFARDGALHYGWEVNPKMPVPSSRQNKAGTVKAWVPTPPDKGGTRYQIHAPGSGRGGKKSPDYQPPPDPVEGVTNALKGLDKDNITPEQAEQVKGAISKMTVAQTKALMKALGVQVGGKGGIAATKKAGLSEQAGEQALQRAGQEVPAPAPKKPAQPRAASPEAAQARVQADMKALEPHLKGAVSANQLAHAANISRPRVMAALGELVDQKKVKADTGGRFTRYSLVRSEGESPQEPEAPAPQSEKPYDKPPPVVKHAFGDMGPVFRKSDAVNLPNEPQLLQDFTKAAAKVKASSTGGVISIANVYKELKAQHSDLTLPAFQRQLLAWQQADKLTLQAINIPGADPEAARDGMRVEEPNNPFTSKLRAYINLRPELTKPSQATPAAAPVAAPETPAPQPKPPTPQPQQPTTPAVPAPQSAPQTPAAQTPLENVLSGEPMTKAELAKRAGMTGDQVFRALQPLERAGLAVSEFKGGSAVYRLTPAGDAVAPLRKLLEHGVTSPGRAEAVLADLRRLDDRGLAAVAKAVGIQPGATAAATLGEIQNRINEKQRQTAQQPFDAASHVPALKAAVEKHGGPHNLASMVDIRRALPSLSREEQDQVAAAAVKQGVLDRSSLEGRQGITPEEHEAAIHEGDQRLGYLSLKNKVPKAAPVAAQPPPRPRKLPTEKFEPVDMNTPSPEADVNAPSPHLPSQARPDLSQDEAQSLRTYSMHFGGDLNQALYGNEDWTPELKDINGKLQSIFQKTKPLDKPVRVYRGLAFDAPDLESFVDRFRQAMASGKPLELPGYQSTSTDRKAAENWGGGANLVYEIDADRGLDMKPYSIAPKQWEFLINHGQSYKVEGIKNEGGRYVVHLEQLPARTSQDQ